MPQQRYRLDQALRQGEPFFERPANSSAEDTLRARRLQTADVDRRDARRVERLARRLMRGVACNQPPVTLASSQFMRDLRLRVTGAIWQLHDECQGRRRAVFTLIPRGLSFTLEQLRCLDPRRLIEQLRAALKRAGSGRAGGALVAFLHGEFDQNAGRFQLHFHGWAVGKMVEVVDQLRRQRAFNSADAANARDTDGVTTRVRLSRKRLRNPAYRLSYRLQSFWPGRPTGVFAETKMRRGRRSRVRGKRRIPEPFHAAYLLWLDRWRLEDISLLVGVGVRGGRLRLTQLSSTNRVR